MSSAISSLEDDESAQCSNLQAIAMVENESRRYDISTLVITIDTNIKSFMLEKERIKRKDKRKDKRYPSYGHLRGKSSLINNHLQHNNQLQRVISNCQPRGGRAHGLSCVRTSSPPGTISRGPVRPMMLKIRKRSKSSTPSTLISNPKTNYNTPSGSMRKPAPSS